MKEHACFELQASQRDPGGRANMTSSLYLQKIIPNLKVEVGRLVKKWCKISLYLFKDPNKQRQQQPLCQVCNVLYQKSMNKKPLHVARLETGKPTTTIAPWLQGAYAFERFYQGPGPQEMEDGGNQDDVC